MLGANRETRMTVLYTLVLVAIGGYYLWQSRSLQDPRRRTRQQWLAWILIVVSVLVFVLNR
jgi:hypothetical protein